jgi:hypothetical protein
MSDQSETQEEKQSWLEVSQEINKAIFETHFIPEESYEDEEW